LLIHINGAIGPDAILRLYDMPSMGGERPLSTARRWISPNGEHSMQTFAMLTRLEPDGLQSPTAVEDLEHRVMEHVRVACPTAQWIGSYAICGPYDYLDLFRAQDLDDAIKISAIVRSYGHAHTEVWPLTEWSHFKTVIHELGIVRA
jgi:hypothetical protein